MNSVSVSETDDAHALVDVAVELRHDLRRRRDVVLSEETNDDDIVVSLDLVCAGSCHNHEPSRRV